MSGISGPLPRTPLLLDDVYLAVWVHPKDHETLGRDEDLLRRVHSDLAVELLEVHRRISAKYPDLIVETDAGSALA